MVATCAVVMATTTAPASAISDEDLRVLRLELQGALGELETATWDRRIAAGPVHAARPDIRGSRRILITRDSA